MIFLWYSTNKNYLFYNKIQLCYHEVSQEKCVSKPPPSGHKFQCQQHSRVPVCFVLQDCHHFLHGRPLPNVITGNNIAPKSSLVTPEEDCGVGLEGWKNNDGTSAGYIAFQNFQPNNQKILLVI